MNLLEQLNKERGKRSEAVLEKLKLVSFTASDIEKIGISSKSAINIKGRFKQGKAGWEAILLFEKYFSQLPWPRRTVGQDASGIKITGVKKKNDSDK